MCSFNWAHRYETYLWPIRPHMPKLMGTVERRDKFVSGSQGSGDSENAADLFASGSNFYQSLYDWSAATIPYF